jgi:hypothetical protein
MISFPPEWSECIDLLCAHRVRFLVVGAHALAASGRPRATQDLDLWVEPDEANARRLGAALADSVTALSPASGGGSPRSTGWQPSVVRHSRSTTLTSISGVTFAQAWKGRRRLRHGLHWVGFLGARELIRNKRAAGRPKDGYRAAEGGPTTPSPVKRAVVSAVTSATA